MSEPIAVGNLMVAAVFDQIKSEKLLDWWTTDTAPAGLTLTVTKVTEDQPETDLAISVVGPMGTYHRMYTISQQRIDWALHNAGIA